MKYSLSTEESGEIERASRDAGKPWASTATVERELTDGWVSVVSVQEEGGDTKGQKRTLITMHRMVGVRNVGLTA